MNLPNPPKSDEAVHRHSFYSDIPSSIECLSDKIDNDQSQIKENNIQLYDKYGQIKTQLEELHVRINRRVYDDDFRSLKSEVHLLKQQEIAHRTAWATGRTFIFGAWIVFAVLFGWAYSLTQKNMESYLNTITANEQSITKINAKALIIDDHILEGKLYHEEKAKQFEELKEKSAYLDSTLQNYYKDLNSLNNTIKQLENKVNEKN